MADATLSPVGDNFSAGPFRDIKRAEETLANTDTITITGSSSTAPVYGQFRDNGLDDIQLSGVDASQNLTLFRDPNILTPIPEFMYYFSKDGAEIGNWSGASVIGWGGTPTKNSTDNEFGSFCMEFIPFATTRRTFNLGRNKTSITLRYKTDPGNTAQIRLQNTSTLNELQSDGTTWAPGATFINLNDTAGVWETIVIGDFIGETNGGDYRFDYLARSTKCYLQGFYFEIQHEWSAAGGNANTFSTPTNGINQVSPLWKGNDYETLALVPHSPTQDELTLDEGAFWSTADTLYYRLASGESVPEDADLKMGDGSELNVDISGSSDGVGFDNVVFTGGQRGAVADGSATNVTGDNFKIKNVGGIALYCTGSSQTTYTNFELFNAINTPAANEGGLEPMPIGLKGEGYILASTADTTGSNFTISNIHDDCIQPLGTGSMILSDFTATSSLESSGSVLEVSPSSGGVFDVRRCTLTSDNFAGGPVVGVIRDKGDITSVGFYEDVRIINNSVSGSSIVIDTPDGSRTTGSLTFVNTCVAGTSTGVNSVDGITVSACKLGSPEPIGSIAKSMIGSMIGSIVN